jgi:hypothetical protein
LADYVACHLAVACGRLIALLFLHCFLEQSLIMLMVGSFCIGYDFLTFWGLMYFGFLIGELLHASCRRWMWQRLCLKTRKNRCLWCVSSCIMLQVLHG